MSVKMATLGIFKIKVFRNQGYDVTNKFYRDSNYTVDVVL